MHTDIYNILLVILGILVSTVGFFLMRTMSKLDATHDMAFQNKMDYALLKKEFDITLEHIDEKLDDIKCAVSEIKTELKRQ